MKTNKFIRTLLTFSICLLLSNVVLADENKANVSGNIRFGYIAVEDENDNITHSSAIGGNLHYDSTQWNGLSVGGTLYATQKLFNDENNDFFDSNGDSYAILGEGYIKANIGNTQVQAGRFEFDTPHADTDDIRMIPNTFSGIVVSNTDIKDTTLYFTHLNKLAGTGGEKPEKFTEINGDYGLTAIGAVYEGIENISLQTWYYHGNNFADLFYAEAIYEVNSLTIGAQFSSQSDKTNENNGPDGKVYGVMASYSINDVSITAAYNTVSGSITNGFGGGPFFSNAGDHTIDGTIDQNAFATGLDYTGFDNLTLGILNVVFDKGADEINLFANYEFSDNMIFDFTYHHMHSDGDMVLAMFNYRF